MRHWLEEQGYSYALAVPSTEVVCVQTAAGYLLADVASIAQQAVGPQDWQRLSQSQGTKGERFFDWARLPLVQRGVVDERHWLLIRRCLDDPTELAYYLVFAPLGTPLPIMVQAIGARWSIEEDLQVSKDLGLDQYEVRSYLGWYRHYSEYTVSPDTSLASKRISTTRHSSCGPCYMKGGQARLMSLLVYSPATGKGKKFHSE